MLSLGVFALVGGTTSAQAAPSGSGSVGSYVVELRPGFEPSRWAHRVASTHGGSASQVYDRALRGFAFTGSERAAGRLALDPRVASVEPDAVFRLADATVGHNHLKRTDSPRAMKNRYDGEGVRIAVLDTGVNRNHEVFQAHNNIRGGKSCVKGGTYDHEGHGTASASNAVGRIGVAHRAIAVPVKIFPPGSLSTTLANVICGLNWVKANNDSGGPKISVVSLSLAGPGGNALRKAVQRLLDDGVVLVAAAGNTFGGPPQFPARYKGVISVTALAAGARLATFSAVGGTMTAPGHLIVSAENDSNRAYSQRSGTSRSAPQVAGAAAIVLGEDATKNVRAALRTAGKCPNGTINGSTGWCSGRWKRDTDGRTEPLVQAYCSGVWAAAGSHPARCGF